MDNDIEAKTKQIQTIFPDKIETIDIDHKGEDFLVIEVNKEWIFRFPRNAYARQTLPIQIRFLPRLAQISPLPIPEPKFTGSEFFGYRKIKGILLTCDLFKTLSVETQRVIARQIGSFLSVLHAFPLDQARSLGVTESWGGWRNRAAERFQNEVAPSLSVQTRKKVLEFVEEFFSMEFKPALIHGDFYPPDHLFFDQETQRLAGVIDFGDLTIEDRATDFQSIYADFGQEYYHHVLSNYSGEVDARLFDRVKMRIKAHPIFDAVYALEYNQPERFKKNLTEIEMEFGRDKAFQ